MLTRDQINDLLRRLNERLAAEKVAAELHLVGGAVMCLVYAARPATADVDAVFQPQATVRRLARQVAGDAGVVEDWLNDAVKGYLSPAGEFRQWLELSHLRVYVPDPAYLLAMKCLAFRLGAEHRDEDDVRYLLRYLNLETAADALAVVERYYPADRIPVKTRLALEELLPTG